MINDQFSMIQAIKAGCLDRSGVSSAERLSGRAIPAGRSDQSASLLSRFESNFLSARSWKASAACLLTQPPLGRARFEPCLRLALLLVIFSKMLYRHLASERLNPPRCHVISHVVRITQGYDRLDMAEIWVVDLRLCIFILYPCLRLKYGP